VTQRLVDLVGGVSDPAVSSATAVFEHVKQRNPSVSFLQVIFCEAPYNLHALPTQTVFDFLSQLHNKLCHFISDVVDYFWLAKTSNKPISLTTSGWLAINPNL